MERKYFQEVLACLESEYSGGIPPKIVEESEESIKFSHFSQEDKTHRQMPLEYNEKQLGINHPNLLWNIFLITRMISFIASLLTRHICELLIRKLDYLSHIWLRKSLGSI